MAETDQTNNGRRVFLKKLLGVAIAPVVPVPETAVPVGPRYEVGLDLAAGHTVDALRYVMVMDPASGRMGMFSYGVVDGERVRVEKVLPGGTALT